RLRQVNGELVVYPHARSVRLQFPARGHLPQTQTAEGLRVTLQEFRWENHTATAVLTEEWPAGVAVSRIRPEIPFGIIAQNAAGVPTYASEGRSTSGPRKESEQSQYFRLTFPDMEQPPDRLLVEALV